ncbi:MAG TPA: bile acid:sodium symporter family protein [Xanthobacteraceae bacterium]|nr:bile acid:sodium symporter family protein [Xanthobacteraceae bacterium]
MRPRAVVSRLDPFLVALVATLGLATLVPATGEAASAVGGTTHAAIALMFFLHGARLSSQAAVAGAAHWRLHAMVFFGTFVLFPLIGLGARALCPGLLSPALWTGVILLTTLPSTVQASVAFTTLAGGNVPAAMCSASVSNLLGVFLSPLLCGILLTGARAGASPQAVFEIIAQLAVPFLLGQLLRPVIGDFVKHHTGLLKFVDYGSVLLIVYAAFSQGVADGIWQQIKIPQLIELGLINAALLAAVMITLTTLSRRLGFSRADEITIAFCGSKKSLVSGLPIAAILFPGSPLGLIVLPIMLFHQMQLMVCAAMARRYAAQRVVGNDLGRALLAA